MLDNCEHVLEPVAALVAFLLATTRDLQVLATSRAPLRLAAERAMPLSQLSASDAEELFVRRASATRPDAVLDPAAVRAVVERLDGLPLAVELAAARVRTMTVAEVATALDDRFAALRSRDRSTPERHRTLEAVIAWSWDLLAPDEQRALAWLSVFQDGFDRATATAVLGPDGPDLVDALVEQSLLVMGEDGGAPGSGPWRRSGSTPRPGWPRRASTTTPSPPSAAGRSTWRTGPRTSSSPTTRSSWSTSWSASRTTSPTCCATRCPSATGTWSPGWSRCSAASGRSPATSPGSSRSATRPPSC